MKKFLTSIFFVSTIFSGIAFAIPPQPIPLGVTTNGCANATLNPVTISPSNNIAAACLSLNSHIFIETVYTVTCDLSTDHRGLVVWVSSGVPFNNDVTVKQFNVVNLAASKRLRKEKENLHQQFSLDFDNNLFSATNVEMENDNGEEGVFFRNLNLSGNITISNCKAFAQTNNPHPHH